MQSQEFLLHRARKMLGDANSSILGVGRILQTVLKKGGFNDFCEALPMHHRKARDLAAIAVAVDKHLLAEKDILELGWSKARTIAAGAKTKAGAKKAIAYATVHSSADLAKYLKTGKHKKLIAKTFFLTKAEANELEEALLRAGASIKGGRYENREEGLMTIVRQYVHAKLPLAA
ncbi:MAG TPA: hypothetical protein VND19_18895 [Acetobacteraceae bacterium]|nr:hypothetical protein [Acetobacteraceae bacterium]